MKKICLLLFSFALVAGIAIAKDKEEAALPVAPAPQYLTVQDLAPMINSVNGHTQNLITLNEAIARLNFIFEELKKNNENLGESLEQADAAWLERLDVISKQAEAIAVRDAELAKQRKEIDDLKTRLAALEESKDEETN